MIFTEQKKKCTSRTIFLSLLLLAAFYAAAYGTELTPRAKKLLHGRTVQADFGFDMYKDRSARSIAEEIAANGYEGVYYFVVSDSAVRKDIISELQKRGISVAALVIASGAYLPVDERPQDWEKYRMEFTNNRMDEYKFMSFVHKDYAIWMKHRIVKLINQNGFDGFTFAEAMYPVTDGLERKDVFTGMSHRHFRLHSKKLPAIQFSLSSLTRENGITIRKFRRSIMIWWSFALRPSTIFMMRWSTARTESEINARGYLSQHGRWGLARLTVWKNFVSGRDRTYRQ